MPDLTFTCTAIEPDRFAAAPAVTLRMHASGPPGVRVHAAAIRCQVRIEPRRRGYTEAEGQAMADLFGGRERWGTTMQALQLAFLSHLLPGFVGETDFDLSLPCSRCERKASWSACMVVPHRSRPPKRSAIASPSASV